MDLDKFLAELDNMEEVAKRTETRSGKEAVEHLQILMAYLARCGEMLAEAEGLKNRAVGEVHKRLLLKGTAPTSATAVANYECSEIIQLWRRTERLNRTLVHQIDAVRTIVSYMKQEVGKGL
jgi:hypothetical protein